MSADNWTTCPQCVASRRAEMEAAEQRLAGAYGKVSREEYMAWIKEASDLRSAFKTTLRQTFREDYEIGINPSNQTFYANYYGNCEVCGLSHSFKREEALVIQIPPMDKVSL